jgi:hypothetical protein
MARGVRAGFGSRARRARSPNAPFAQIRGLKKRPWMAARIQQVVARRKG